MDNNILEFKYNTIINTLLEGASLGYENRSLRFANDGEISTIIKALEPEQFDAAIKLLKAKKESEDLL